jgi:predicted dehydrogenase
MKKKIKWGILGPGKIADKFASAFTHVPDATLQAVASRDEVRASAFAAKFGIPTVHSTYEALAADPDVDIIYVATPHNFHHEQTILCLKNKKAVLCEKPLTLSTESAMAMIRTAEENDVFLMEGMWSRFFPYLHKTLELIQAGTIGEVQFVRADFGFTYPFDPQSRVYNIDLAAGAQLDVGIYPMFLALVLLGKPDRIQALAKRTGSGVDIATSAQFFFRNGSMAHIFSSVVTESPKQAEIMGTLGTLTIHAPWYKSQAITVKNNDGTEQLFQFPFEGFGFQYQLQHVTECMQEGLKESPLMSFDFTLMMAEVADKILSQCDVVYPHKFL